MSVRVILSVLIFLSLIIAGMVAGGRVESFINLPSVIIVLGGIGCGTTCSYTTKQISQAYSVASQGTTDAQQAQSAHIIFSKMAELSIASGLLGTLIGLVNMLANLDDPSAIGPAMAVALLTIFYGVIFSEFVFKPAANNCLSQHNPGLHSSQRGFITIYMAFISLFVLLTTFFVMLLAFADFG